MFDEKRDIDKSAGADDFWNIDMLVPPRKIREYRSTHNTDTVEIDIAPKDKKDPSSVRRESDLIIKRFIPPHTEDEFIKPDKVRGVCLLKSAIDYIYPFVLHPEAFPYAEMFNDEVYPTISYFALMALTWADAHFPADGYGEKIKAVGEKSYLLRPGK